MKAKPIDGTSSPAICRKVIGDVNGKVLDLGAGKGNFTKVLLNKGRKEIYACDKYPNLFEIQDVKCKRCDLDTAKIPFKTAFFDTVVCLEVIEHVENPWRLLREIRRVLKKGGKVILSTPNISSLRSRLSFLFRGYSSFSIEKIPFHKNIFTERTVLAMLEKSGFTVKNVCFSDCGAIPKTPLAWQKFFPFLKGELFSDNIIMLARKK